MNILFYDLETTGFDRRWCSIIEIAAILYNMDEHKILDTFHEYIRPIKPIPAQITKLTGITNKMVANCRTEPEVVKSFFAFAMRTNWDAICGHNCKAFDNQFMKIKGEVYNLPWEEVITGKQIIDTYQLAKQYKKDGKIVGTSNLRQPTLAEYYGIDYEAHSAIEDVGALIKIYEAMTSKKVSRESLGF
jgi:DNA polymerase III epsilon subunit-like protein